MLVLWRREMNSTTILYMRGLVITDTGILLGSVLTLTPIACADYLQTEALSHFKHLVYPALRTPAYYVVMTLQQINVWITVSVSVERYVAICHPFRAARLITRRNTVRVMLAIAAASLLYNLPRVFAYRTVDCDAAGAAGGGGNGSSGCLDVITTEFGQTDLYNFYRTIMYLIIIYVLPFLCLLVLNGFLLRELMSMQRRKAATSSKEENEANLSLVLVLIVVVFLFCQTPGLISQFDLIHFSLFIPWLGFSNFLFATNSAVNFLIYTAFGRKFRRVLLRVFRHI
ncbi:hypothetical protein EGW08_009649, partial [Elysia chlorotica]